jgi:XapX domain-containing protein
MKILLGFLLAIGIGALCRLAGVPLPAPPILIGALLVVAMSTGYAVTDRFARHRAAVNRAHCGGPTGERAEMREGAS